MIKILRYASAVLFIIVLVAIVFLSFAGSKEMSKVKVPFNDKISHCFAYVCLSFIFGIFLKTFDKSTVFVFVFSFLVCLALGLAVELLQPYFGRSCEMLDFVADFLGTLLGVVASIRTYNCFFSIKK